MTGGRIFAATYAVVAAAGELTGYGDRRAEVLRGARGRLLIVGVGPGHDLRHLPRNVTDVVAVEPSAAMRRRAARRVVAAPIPVRLVGGTAEALPLPDSSVDSALSALVLCSVADPVRSATELRRVLRSEGTLHVLEHVHARPGSGVRRWQDRLDPVWTRLAGGCHVTRNTRATLEAAGFDTTALLDTKVRPAPPMVGPHLVGVARPRGAA